MKETFEILIADRNSHVRELIKRELAGKDCRIREAQSGREALKAVYHDDSLDLIIIDPDMQDIDSKILLRKLNNRVPSIPIILHAFPPDISMDTDGLPSAVRVEKRENSVDEIKHLTEEFHRQRKSASSFTDKKMETKDT